MLWLRDDGTGSGGLSAGLAGVALTQALQLVGMFQVRLSLFEWFDWFDIGDIPDGV